MFEHHLFPLLLEKRELLLGYPSCVGYWMDMGTPEKYLQLHRDLLGGGHRGVTTINIRASARNAKKGASIHPTAHIEGAVVVGKNCIIKRDVRINGPAVLGNGCQIGDEAVIEDSVLWQNVRTGQRSTVRGSILGNNCAISDGSTVINLVMGDGERR